MVRQSCDLWCTEVARTKAVGRQGWQQSCSADDGQPRKSADSGLVVKDVGSDVDP